MTQSSHADRGWLVLEHGDRAGDRWPIRNGSTLIGRGPEADIVVADMSVSRSHAYVVATNATYEIVDINSSNGTRVNGRTVHGRCELHDNDVLSVGAVHLRLHTGPAPSQPHARPPQGSTHQTFGDVGGNVHVGAGNQYNAGRDLHHVGQQHNQFSIEPDNPLDELFAGVGAGRVIMILGGLLALGGFAIWMYVIFTPGPLEPGPDTGFFDAELIDGVPLGVVGFAMFGIGAVMFEIGRSMSRTKRRR